MQTHHSNPKRINGVLVLVVIGLIVAGGIFLVVLITTQKAATPHPRANLRIPVLTPPPKATIPLRFRPSPILIASPFATPLSTPIPSTKVTTPSPLLSPSSPSL